eukprot:Em0008g192a
MTTSVTDEPTADPAPVTSEDSVYQLKWIEWNGAFAPIVTQNRNGPCPLLALCNALLLRQMILLSYGSTVTTSSQLIHKLGALLLEGVPKDLPEGERSNYEQNIQDAMAVFPKLQTGLDINVVFNTVTSFEFTSEMGVFDLLGVQLYHGWLPDPQDTPTHDLVHGLSYNQLVEKSIVGSGSGDPQEVQNALLREQFLQSSGSQLTYHGLCELNTCVPEGEIAVFFRNNHFSTLMKRQGRLLLLVTDHGFVNEQEYVWQFLQDIDGDGDFLDARFKRSKHSRTQTAENQSSLSSPSPTPPSLTSPMADDRVQDYQLALRLQQEEQHRAIQARDQALAMRLQKQEVKREREREMAEDKSDRGECLLL